MHCSARFEIAMAVCYAKLRAVVAPTGAKSSPLLFRNSESRGPLEVHSGLCLPDSSREIAAQSMMEDRFAPGLAAVELPVNKTLRF